MKNILLTGGAGYIGSHTAVELLERGYQVIITDDFSNCSPKVIDQIERITGNRPICYAIDVANRDSLDAVFQRETLMLLFILLALRRLGSLCRSR